MIIPIRCITCGKVIADKWMYYKKQIEKNKEKEKENSENEKEDSENKKYKNIDPNFNGKLLDDIGITKICCRRHMISHVDLIDII